MRKIIWLRQQRHGAAVIKAGDRAAAPPDFDTQRAHRREAAGAGPEHAGYPFRLRKAPSVRAAWPNCGDRRGAAVRWSAGASRPSTRHRPSNGQARGRRARRPVRDRSTGSHGGAPFHPAPAAVPRDGTGGGLSSAVPPPTSSGGVSDRPTPAARPASQAPRERGPTHGAQQTTHGQVRDLLVRAYAPMSSSDDTAGRVGCAVPRSMSSSGGPIRWRPLACSACSAKPFHDDSGAASGFAKVMTSRSSP